MIYFMLGLFPRSMRDWSMTHTGDYTIHPTIRRGQKPLNMQSLRARVDLYHRYIHSSL